MRNRCLIGLLVGLLGASWSWAATPTIELGTYVLQANTIGQTVQVLVSGGDPVTGFNLRAQIGNGVSVSPKFQAISFTGGIWDANANTTTGGPIASFEQYAQASVAFNTNVTVPASGVLATLTIDTTGITTEGFYALKFKDTDIGQDSDFLLSGGGTQAPAITNGTIHVVVPEPATLGLLAVFSLALCVRRRK